MTGIAEVTAELAGLWPALAAALARDAAGEGAVPGHAAAAAAVVNADVLAAMLALGRGIPEAVREACEVTGEPWRHRDITGCLLQVPRLHGRLRDLGLAAAEKALERQALGWLRVTKRALGLRKPDLEIGYACPYAEPNPGDHEEGCMLLAAGEEGHLREGPGGLRVEWSAQQVIYCVSPECGASWPLGQWTLLGKMLGTPSMVSA